MNPDHLLSALAKMMRAYSTHSPATFTADEMHALRAYTGALLEQAEPKRDGPRRASVVYVMDLSPN